MAVMTVPYGKAGRRRVIIPDRNLVGVFAPRDVPVSDANQLISHSLDHPVGAPSIDQFLDGGRDIVFIVNDGTRPTPTASILDALADRIDLTTVRFLIATGAHRAPTEEELRFIFGRHLEKLRSSIHVHDARKDRCLDLGRSQNGTVMEVNEMAVKADRLVIITSVEPHYFAGYTGGRKSFLPGVASYCTIEQNHRLAMNPEARVLRLEGNPVHEDMIDALKQVAEKPIFSIQVVMDRHQDVYQVICGDLFQAFDRAVVHAEEVFSVPVPEKADMVITIAPYPMDVDLYQSQKAIENAKLVLKEGGVVLMVSKCREGIGDETFYHQLSSSPDPRAVLQAIEAEYRLGYHKAAKLAELLTWAEIWAVTDLDRSCLTKVNFRPFGSVQEAVDTFLKARPEGKILVLMDGSVTVPRLEV